MSMTKMTTYQINCDKVGCQVGVVETVDTRERAAEKMLARGWVVVLYDDFNEKVLCPRCKPVQA